MQSETYHVRLMVHVRDGGYEAHWVEPEGQVSKAFPLDLPLDESDHGDLRWYLEEYANFVGAGDRVRAAQLDGRINGWGSSLFDALFDTADGARVHMRLMDAAKEGRPAILTLGTNEPDIHVQPWELLRDSRGPLVFQGVTIRRQLQGVAAARRHALTLPLTVLMITSRPRDAGFIDPRNSIAPMLDALDALPGQVTVEFCEPPTLARLEQLISTARKQQRPFDIVHFDGHGTYLKETGVGALAFERDASGEAAHLVEGRKLGDLLARLEVPLVLLEACRSSALSDRPIFGSVAPALLESGVGSVIAFSHSVHIEAAKLLVGRFYQELADGLTVGQALEEARARLRAEPARWLNLGPDPDTIDLQDWFIPQLYQVGADPALAATHNSTAPTPAARSRAESLHGFPPPPMYRFHGRAMELLELERAFRRHPALLVTGMGGMGKTALAREAADWWLRTERFEAAIFHSFEQKAGAERVVQVLGQALAGDGFSSRPAEEQWSSAVTLFRERRVLLVWDNFESTLPEFQHGEDGDAPLLFGSKERRLLRKLYHQLTAGDPLGRILVTCRPQETGLPDVHEVPLGGLARPDSLHLLAAVLYQRNISTDRVGYEREAIDALLDAVDDHPLSISLVAPHLKTLTPVQIFEELDAGPDRFADASAGEARNRSLMASLEFSTRRLSQAARDVLPYLAWFEGGAFENSLLEFVELNVDVWETIRGELVATALIRLEEYPWAQTPFLRFHPTLRYAARPHGTVGDTESAEEVEARFIAAYLEVGHTVQESLFDSRHAAGMALMTLEEANFRSALQHAFHRDDRQEGAALSDTLGEYLKRAGRMRERDDFVEWVRSRLLEDAGLDESTSQAIRQHAFGLLNQGRVDEAVTVVRELIARLETEGLRAEGEGPTTPTVTFQVATSNLSLGQIHLFAHQPELTLKTSRQAIALLEGLSGAVAAGNTATALGDLASAHLALGQFDQALTAGERSLAMNRQQGRDREVILALNRIAQILAQQQRYAKAEGRYAEAFEAAASIGDLESQGMILQHQAALNFRIGRQDQAIELGKRALIFFQQGGDVEGEMGTCGLLAGAEQQLGRLEAAEAWYARSRELAEKANDRFSLAMIAHNIGTLYQECAARADNPQDRGAFLRRAISSAEDGLAIRLEIEDQISIAASYQGLGILCQQVGELDRAEEYLQRSLATHESLDLPDVHKDYATLADIARARGDANAASGWQAKSDAKVAELERRHHGGGR